MKFDRADVDIRVIDQRIGMGVGGLDTVIRAVHKPTGVIVEMPKLHGSQHNDLQAALDAIEVAIFAVVEE